MYYLLNNEFTGKASTQCLTYSLPVAVTGSLSLKTYANFWTFK